jgi:ABC-type iron transport system FetAB ATPase subunit
LLGHWKNYDELESNLCMEELILTVKASRDKEDREKRFLAAINGVDLDEQQEVGDISDLQGREAQREGFGINEGLGFMQMGE